MTYISSLIVLIQDRINHLESVKSGYDDRDIDMVNDEIATLEKCLDLLVTLDD